MQTKRSDAKRLGYHQQILPKCVDACTQCMKCAQSSDIFRNVQLATLDNGKATKEIRANVSEIIILFTGSCNFSLKKYVKQRKAKKREANQV